MNGLFLQAKALIEKKRHLVEMAGGLLDCFFASLI